MKDEQNNEIITENEDGASMLEYAIMAALIAVVCIASVTYLGQQASEAFSNIAVTLDNSSP